MRLDLDPLKDVCNGRAWDRGTTPQDFYNNVVGAMEYLDQTLARTADLPFSIDILSWKSCYLCWIGGWKNIV